MSIRNFVKYILNRLCCLKFSAPKDCLFHYTDSINNTIFEGKNKVAYDAKINNSDIGFGTYIAQNSQISRCKIGRYSLVGFESLIGGHPIHKVASVHPALYSTRAQYGFTYVTKNSYDEYSYVDDEKKYAIVIGNDVWVTAGSTKIVQGVTIGDGAVVMADAVVTKDVPPYAIVGGIPAKIIGYRFKEEDIEFLLKLKWWDRGETWIKEHAEFFSSIDILKKIVFDEEPNFMLEIENQAKREK